MPKHLHDYKSFVGRVRRTGNSVMAIVYIDSGDISYFKRLGEFWRMIGQQVPTDLEDMI